MFPVGSTFHLLAILLGQLVLELLEPLALGLLHVAPGGALTHLVVAGVDRLHGRG